MNAQPWLFAVVQDRARLHRYSERAKGMLLEARGHDAKLRHYDAQLRDPRFNIFYDAGTLVTIGEAPRSTYTDANCWLAAAAFMLAAYDAGLGTCPIGFAVPVLNAPDVKQELGYPSDAVVVAAIIVGYPDVTPPAVPRRDPRIVGWLT